MMTLKQAKTIVGLGAQLGNPSKMPGWSFGIPAKHCKTGARLSKIEGSVCAGCYAKNANYLYDNVMKSHEKRFQHLDSPQWVDAMVRLINHYAIGDKAFFRWHDAGDIQSASHLLKIIGVARRCPTVKFWLPTKEPGFVLKAVRMVGGWSNMPTNLVIRVSVFMRGDAPPQAWVDRFKTTSTVDWQDGAHQCPAPSQDGYCGDCRACWDSNVANVNYKWH
jgi:hypothetical protein